MPAIIPSAGSDVVPPGDADFGLFATQFASAWVPATYNTVLPAAATVTTSAAAYATALAIATDPGSRSTVNIATKTVQKLETADILRSAIRSAQTAYLDGLVSEAQLNNLGVRANSLIRTPIGQPVFSPILGIDGSLTGQNRFRVTQVDPATGIAVTTRAYAYGIVGVEMQRKVGAGEFLLRQTTRRTKIFDSTTDLAMGTVAIYRVRYITARGLTSPWSATVQGVAS